MYIRETHQIHDFQSVRPDFIFNRFDLYCPQQSFTALKIINGSTEKVIQIRFDQDTAELGIWLVELTWTEMGHVFYWIHTHHPEIKKAVYKNGTVPFGKIKSHNHFRIVLPETREEMMERVSGTSRKKLRKKMRLAQEKYGPLTIHEFEHELPDEVVNAFFQFKYETRGRLYNMTPQEYVSRYHISHAYIFRLGDEIAAVRFACEQCEVVYGENFAYNPKFADYSMGTCIFFYHLLRLVEKKHTQLFFAGGEFEYKKHYGSIEEKLFDCEVNLDELDYSRFSGLVIEEVRQETPVKHKPALFEKLFHHKK